MNKNKKITFLLSLIVLIYGLFPWGSYFQGNTMVFDGKVGVSKLLNKNYTIKEAKLNISSFPTKTMLLGEIIFKDDVWVFPEEVSVEDKKKSGAILNQNNTLSGFVKSNKYGLIKLSSKDEGVRLSSKKQNDKTWGIYRTGNILNGYAWNDAIGWICFGSCMEEDFKTSIKSENYNSFLAFVSLLNNIKLEASFILQSIIIIYFLFTEVSWTNFYIKYLKRKNKIKKPPKK
jgi:hypothetical protein